jgi:DNA adenine methylase
MIKSPLRYPGGKSRAIKAISKLIPEFDEFREPFVGGGSVFCYLKQRYPQKNFWVNDLYSELFKFWAAARDNSDELIKKIYEWRAAYPIGKELYRFLNNNLHLFDDLEKGAAFFIYNRITFSGTSLSGGYSESAFKARFTQSSLCRLKEFANLLNGVKITNCDYEELTAKQGSNAFIFLDPPYYCATKSALYGKNGNLHKSFDHKRFAQAMKTCPHKWLITYDDSKYIRDLFSFADIISWNITYGMKNVGEHSSQTGKELFISNYLSQSQYEAIQYTQANFFAA